MKLHEMQPNKTVNRKQAQTQATYNIYSKWEKKTLL